MRNLHGGVDGGGDEEEGLVLPAVEQRVQRLVGRHADDVDQQRGHPPRDEIEALR